MDEWIAQADGKRWHMRGGEALAGPPPAGLEVVSCGEAGAAEVMVPALLPGAREYVAPAGPLPAYVQESPKGRLDCAAARAAGLLAERPQFDGIACITGARCHWLRISAGELVAFQSSLTGRLIAAFGEPDPGAGFEEAVSRSLSRPQALAADLAAAELGGQAGAITGHFVGADLAAARPWWLGMEVVVIGDGPLAEAYAAALAGQGAAPGRLGGEQALRAGLWALRRAQRGGRDQTASAG